MEADQEVEEVAETNLELARGRPQTVKWAARALEEFTGPLVRT